MSSFPVVKFEPDEGARESKTRFEVSSEFFESSGDSAKMLESGKQVFDQMTVAIEISIKIRFWIFGIHSFRNDRPHVSTSRLVSNHL